jgi:hypothetical protein
MSVERAVVLALPRIRCQIHTWSVMSPKSWNGSYMLAECLCRRCKTTEDKIPDGHLLSGIQLRCILTCTGCQRDCIELHGQMQARVAQTGGGRVEKYPTGSQYCFVRTRRFPSPGL